MDHFALVIAVLWLAWSNGANDNFKGVATLYGSGLSSFGAARAWSTIASAAGALTAVLVGRELVAKFSGRGILPPEVDLGAPLLTAVAGAAAATVFLATVTGFPTSTTHALTGALLGAALAVGGTGPRYEVLGRGFFLPLLTSPVISGATAAAGYAAVRRLATRGKCVCAVSAAPAGPAGGSGASSALIVGAQDACEAAGATTVVSTESAGRGVQFLSGGALCFARALNDAPKIAALQIAATSATSSVAALCAVTGAMTLGGWFQSRRVAETMSHRIVRLDPNKGLAANLVATSIVLGASGLGLPVSTTHVSVGALFGIGAVAGGADRRVVRQVVLAWLTTLPLAAALGFVLQRVVAGAEI